MGRIRRFINSSVGAKAIVAITGLGIVGYVIVHVAGNFAIYAGQEAMNSYAHFLKNSPALLWGARIALLIIIPAHIYFTLKLAWRNRAARPQRYKVRRPVVSSFTSRTMVLSGLLLGGFIAYHLAHFTLGWTNPEFYHLTDAKGRHDVYSMFVLSFQDWRIASAYIIAMVFLGMHLEHGVSSLFQTLGLNNSRYNPVIRKLGPIIGVVVAVGFISMPVSVLAGWVTLPNGGM